MDSGSQDAVCTVLAAGNANDHSRVMGRKPLAEAVSEGNVRRIDLLRVSTGDNSTVRAEYAQSYIGFGLTPIMAIDLEKGSKGAIKEMFSVVRTFSKFRPFEIRQKDGVRRKFDSLVFANISQMAKYATLIEADDHPSDGKFGVITFAHMAKWRILPHCAACHHQRSGGLAEHGELPFHDSQTHPVTNRRGSEIGCRTYQRPDPSLPCALATLG
ncbi:diacylglycerol kinase [Arthrobacter sp. CAN_C5]|uniref:diacylglycerol kinase n=1 Tax=Arthrobacter sp. CAN_C5 TaxID=2760706 RepID=UPI001FD90B77|nr:diacylglycerol kinase [Arthrobacter sp. CAN_C5]MBP2215138.1 diacylglycerol kinase family enzyme [Arthrobacter sp. CAN_C5]